MIIDLTTTTMIYKYTQGPYMEGILALLLTIISSLSVYIFKTAQKSLELAIKELKESTLYRIRQVEKENSEIVMNYKARFDSVESKLDEYHQDFKDYQKKLEPIFSEIIKIKTEHETFHKGSKR